MSIASRAFSAASGYLRRHPGEISRAIRNLLGLRAGVPVDALRWLMEQAAKGGKVEDPVITEVPPGLRVTATVDLMKTPVRASSVVYIDRVRLDSDQIRLDVRLEEIWMEVIGDAQTPVAALLRSGALDLSKPGELAKYMDLPPVIVEARDNRLALDLMREAKIGENPIVRQALAVVTPLVTMHGIESDEDHLNVEFRTFPQGVGTAAGAIRTHLFQPGFKRVRALLPSFL
ncbi:MAG TPA: hypothetical protein RMH99_17395 [Sandaracinaceae bacterium LLY-WYZ-13_1]|nr:hypothetical protein [Sandaracinaceae bacterium LLY-WYZ-13_1]